MSSPTSKRKSESNSPSAKMGKEDDKPRLTEEEKKKNHIASEHKRRQAIRDGFDRLTTMVPGLEGMARSEGLVLEKTVEFIKAKMIERDELREKVRQLREGAALGGDDSSDIGGAGGHANGDRMDVERGREHTGV